MICPWWLAAYLACCDRVDEAIQLLRAAVAETDRTLLTAEDWSVIESSMARRWELGPRLRAFFSSLMAS